MSALDRVREKFGNLRRGTDRTDKRASVGSVSFSPKESEKFSALSADLERRILIMASRWSYTAGELREVLTRARRNPVAWAAAVALDERREQEFRERGLLPSADA